MQDPQSLILLLLFGGLIFLMVTRTRRQQRETQNLQARLTVGSRIMTTAGLFATVVDLDDTQVTLETGPGQQSQWDRRAVARIISDTPAAPADEPPSDGEAAPEPSPDTAPPDRA